MKKESHIVLIGLPGSGKSTLAKKISKKMDYKIIEIGSFVVSEYKKFDYENPLDFAHNTFKNNNKLYFVKQAKEEILKHKSYCIIVGPRLLEEVEFLKESLKNITCISLEASDETRVIRRLAQLKKLNNAKNKNILYNRDKTEKSWGIEETIGTSDFLVDAENSIDDVFEKVINILERD